MTTRYITCFLVNVSNYMLFCGSKEHSLEKFWSWLLNLAICMWWIVGWKKKTSKPDTGWFFIYNFPLYKMRIFCRRKRRYVGNFSFPFFIFYQSFPIQPIGISFTYYKLPTQLFCKQKILISYSRRL